MSWSRYDLEMYPIVGLHRGMNRLFNRVFTDLGLESANSNSEESRTFSPGLAFSDNEKEVLITLEVPGMSENDLNISLGKDSLTISGEKVVEHERSEGGRYYSERACGSFSRTVPLDCRVDEDKVDAVCKNGVLTLRLPKAADAQKGSRKISVKRG